MGKKICEVIPFKNFRERIKLTKELLKIGITPQNLGDCLIIYYNTKEGKRLCNN